MSKKPIPPVAPPTLRLGPITVQTGHETPDRMAVLIWGPATCGKSTFSATAPGTKLWLSFGDNEHVSVSNRNDVIVANLADMPYDELFKHAQSDNPFGLDQFLAENEQVLSVVCDSLTAIEYRALQKSVHDGIGGGRNFKPTMEAPGISAYGGRNAIVLEVVTGILRVTSKHNVHVIFTAHEADPTMVKEGKESTDIIDYISIMLGGKLVNSTTWRLSEIWYMSQDSSAVSQSRRLMVRPSRKRRPVKTRMFDTHDSPEFNLIYKPDLPDDAHGQMTIAKWYDQWMDNHKARIPIPREEKTNGTISKKAR